MPHFGDIRPSVAEDASGVIASQVFGTRKPGSVAVASSSTPVDDASLRIAGRVFNKSAPAVAVASSAATPVDDASLRIAGRVFNRSAPTIINNTSTAVVVDDASLRIAGRVFNRGAPATAAVVAASTPVDDASLRLAGRVFNRPPVLPTPSTNDASTILAARVFNRASSVTTSSVSAGTTGGAANSPSGRLTLTTGVPVTTADVTGATTIYWCPYKGNQVPLWDGANWTSYTSGQISLAFGTLTAAVGYDVFMYQNLGVPTLEILAWASATARATAVTYQDGRLCKSGAKDRLYLGSFYTTSTTTTADSVLQRFVYNNYNQELRDMNVTDTTADWPAGGTVNVWRQTRATTSNRVECFSGQPQPLDATALSICSGGTGGQNAGSGIGIDSTTANSAQLAAGGIFTTGAIQLFSHYKGPLTVGYHAINWLEIVSLNLSGVLFYGSLVPFFSNGLIARVPG